MTRPADPARGRPEPGPSLESTLVLEVEHAQRRLDSALEDLRNYRLSNPTPPAPSVYERRALLVFGRDDDDDDPPGDRREWSVQY
jgi:hypothetical protein